MRKGAHACGALPLELLRNLLQASEVYLYIPYVRNTLASPPIFVFKNLHQFHLQLHGSEDKDCSTLIIGLLGTELSITL